MKTYIEQLISGDASISNIDNYIELWHNSDSILELHEFLGMTIEEYSDYLTDETSLSNFISFEIWESPNEITFCYKRDRLTSLIPDDASLIYSITESNYNNAMINCHKFLDWEPYQINE